MKKFIQEVISASLIVTLLVAASFIAYEPVSTKAASAEDQFTITQEITSEISFLVAASDLTMSPALGGIVGGTSTAETSVRVLTNNTTGYSMTIKASSSPAMQGISNGATIADYTPATAGIPDFNYSVPSGVEFSYSVSASTTADLAQLFKDDGSACNTGALDTSMGTTSACWYGLSTTATTTINRSTITPASGATTTIYFRLTVNPNTNPTTGFYRATTTLTATTN